MTTVVCKCRNLFVFFKKKSSLDLNILRFKIYKYWLTIWSVTTFAKNSFVKTSIEDLTCKLSIDLTNYDPPNETKIITWSVGLYPCICLSDNIWIPSLYERNSRLFWFLDVQGEANKRGRFRNGFHRLQVLSKLTFLCSSENVNKILMICANVT